MILGKFEETQFCFTNSQPFYFVLEPLNLLLIIIFFPLYLTLGQQLFLLLMLMAYKQRISKKKRGRECFVCEWSYYILICWSEYQHCIYRNIYGCVDTMMVAIREQDVVFMVPYSSYLKTFVLYIQRILVGIHVQKLSYVHNRKKKK